MAIFYTTDPLAFYDEDIVAPPENAKPIAREDRDALILAQASGKRLQVQDDQVVAVDVPPDPIGKKFITPLEFFNRFTPEESHAIATAAMQNALLFLWFTRASAASTIDLTDNQTKQGVQALVQAGLLTSARADEVMTIEQT